MATVAPVKETIMQEAMVEKVETKSAFINKKYSNEDRLKKEEEELEQLVAEQKGEAKQEEASCIYFSFTGATVAMLDGG